MRTARPLLVIVLFLGIWIGWRSLQVSHTNEGSVSQAQSRPSAPSKVTKSVMAPKAPIISEPESSGAPTNRTWRENLMSEDTEGLKLSREELAGYLQANRTNAESLLIAWQASGDREFLRLAVTNFPNDPFVQYSVVAHDLFPEDRREWLERFKQSDPNNSLANYLSARDLMKEGKTELALQELVAASGKTGFNDYTRQKMVGLEEAYLQAGRSAAESKATAMSSVMLPSLAPMKEVGRQMSELQQQYVQSGDQASADAMVRMGVGLARNLDSGPASQTLINHLVSMAIERATLTKLDGEREFDFLGGTVAQRIAELKAEREQIRPITAEFQNWLLGASDTEVIAYFNRLSTYGELSAMKWLKQRQVSPP